MGDDSLDRLGELIKKESKIFSNALNLQETLDYFSDKIIRAMGVPVEYLGLEIRPTLRALYKTKCGKFVVMQTKDVPAGVYRTPECPSLNVAIGWADNLSDYDDDSVQTERYLWDLGPKQNHLYVVVATKSLYGVIKVTDRIYEVTSTSTTVRMTKKLGAKWTIEKLYDGLTAGQCLEAYVSNQLEKNTYIKLTPIQLEAAQAEWKTMLQKKIEEKANADRHQVVCDVETE